MHTPTLNLVPRTTLKIQKIYRKLDTTTGYGPYILVQSVTNRSKGVTRYYTVLQIVLKVIQGVTNCYKMV